MYKTLKELWDTKKISYTELRKAVTDFQWISKDEYFKITGVRF